MKFIFVHKSMNMGGIDKSLLILTDKLCEDNEVKVLLLNDTFGKSLFNEKISFIKSSRLFRILNPMQDFKNTTSSKKSIFYTLAKRLNIRGLVEKISSNTRITEENFDVAIAFHGMDYITCKQVACKINAKSKLVFLHYDKLSLLDCTSPPAPCTMPANPDAYHLPHNQKPTAFAAHP